MCLAIPEGLAAPLPESFGANPIHISPRGIKPSGDGQ
jgi:hypothetical protein